MNDMDIDMTFDGEEDPEIARLQAQAAEVDAVWIHQAKELAPVTNLCDKAC